MGAILVLLLPVLIGWATMADRDQALPIPGC